MRILAFVINSKYRNSGFGKILLNDSERLSKQLNCKAITLNSGNRNERIQAHRLYSKMGLVVIQKVLQKALSSKNIFKLLNVNII